MCFPGGAVGKERTCQGRRHREVGLISGEEDPLEKEMPAHPGTPAWEIPWTEERGGLQPMGSQSLT